MKTFSLRQWNVPLLVAAAWRLLERERTGTFFQSCPLLFVDAKALCRGGNDNKHHLLRGYQEKNSVAGTMMASSSSSSSPRRNRFLMPSDADATCQEDDCGPLMGAPNYLCPDGVTWTGPGHCVFDKDLNSCAWEYIRCPPSPPSCQDDDCGFPMDAPNFLCPDNVTWAGPGDCVWHEDLNVCAWEYIHCPPTSSPPSCQDDDCGPPLLAPNFLCPDNITWAGPGGCVWHEDLNMCAWEYIHCPPSSPPSCQEDDCGPPLLAPNFLCPDNITWAGPGGCVFYQELNICAWDYIHCPSSSASSCEEDDCGPPLMVPNHLCPDNVTIGGPGNCVWMDDLNMCAWEYIHCPSSSCEESDCEPLMGAPNFLCPDNVTWAGPGDCVFNENLGMCTWEYINCP